MPFNTTPISEQRLRITGYLVLAGLFFFFFMLEMAFSWQDEHLYIKIFLLTFTHTLLMWEPTRFLIRYLRRQFAGPHQIRYRVRLLAGISIPYACVLGFLRIYLEDRTNFWGTSVASWGAYSYTIGITLLFILLQVALYEGLNFFWEWNKAILQAEEMKRLSVQVQMDALHVRIQPHFLFNSLNTLIGLIEIHQASAVAFTQNLAAVYRYLLESSERTVVSLAEELRFSENYFSLLKIRYPEGLYLTVDAASAENYQVPPLCLQILVENAVKHNIITKARPLYIDIFLDSRQKEIVVQNNYQPKTVKDSTGLGLQHLRKKLELLNLPMLRAEIFPEAFIVVFPIIKKPVHEHTNY